MRQLLSRLKWIILLAGLTVSLSAQDNYVTSGDFAAMRSSIDYLWIVVAASLVFLMQAGFMAVEAGLSRAKNSINVAIKNVADFIIAAAGFWIVGFGLMFGDSLGGLFGTTGFFVEMDDTWTAVFFLFQVVFVGTSATIDSGSVAERTKFASYLIMSLITSVLIYPVFGHWAWGSFWQGTSFGWLEGKGFIDFAGSTVVHSVGAWVGLAGAIIIGPRIGKFDKDGKAKKIPGHNLPLAFLGVFILFFGWFGFNGGSTLAANDQVPGIIVNTVMAASFGGLSAGILSWVLSPNRLPEPEMIGNGILGGLVAITAGCASFGIQASVVVGIAAGFLIYFGIWFLENVLKIDDVVSAIPVHGFCGAWGTFAVGLFIKQEYLDAAHMTRLDQIGIQSLGVISAFIWSFGLAFLCLKMINGVLGLRVSREHEEMGLNVAEHGSSSSLLELIKTTREVIEKKEYGKEISISNIEHGTEAGVLAESFNEMMKGLRDDFNAKEEHLNAQKAHIEKARAQETMLRLNVDEGIRNILQVMAKANELSRSVESESMSVAKFAHETKDNVAVSVQSIQEVLNNMEEIRTTNTRTIDSMKELNNQIANIWEIVKIISKVADQTKILAFNAELEANAAGDAGKNFTIVAKEIRRLADSTLGSSKDIRIKITQIQKSSEALIGSANNTFGVIEQGNTLSSEMNNRILKIEGTSTASASSADVIADFINQQVESYNTIYRTLKDISSQIDQSEIGDVDYDDPALLEV
ncbi:MAG: ammonium transporter [Spirochaetales bacterium]|nr:ammonium transporter [Spirochaetales bacterium]